MKHKPEMMAAGSALTAAACIDVATPEHRTQAATRIAVAGLIYAGQGSR